MNTRPSTRRRTVLATVSGSTAITVLVAIQALVLAPLFLREVGPELYGAWLATGELLIWIQAFDLGLPNLLIQRIGSAHAKADEKSIGEYLAAGLLVLGGISGLLAAGALAISPMVPQLMGLDGNDARILESTLALACVATATTVVTNGAVGFSRGIQETVSMTAVQVASVLTGFGITVSLLLSGWGLWAAALGITARSAVVVVGSAVFLWSRIRKGLWRYCRFRRDTVKEFLAISPVTALGGLGYTAMTHSEATIIAVFGGPQLAAAYALTRRGADLVRALIDVIGTATYGSFAHLVASADGARSVMVHRQITSLRLSLAVAAGGAYIAANASLVGVWVGPSFYLGLALTILIAVQMIVVGQGYLLNYLYRATGPVATGSWMLLSEALVRIPLMLLLFHAAGVIGIPIAGVVTGTAWAAMTITLTRRTLSRSDARHPLPDRALAAARLATLAAAAVIGSMVQEPSWLWAAGVGTAFAAVALMILVILDPPLVSAISELRRPTSLVRLSPR